MHRLLAIILPACLLCCNSVAALAQVNIWEGTGCHKQVNMTPYVAGNKGGKGVVVCPGGSYFWHDMEAEGHDVARWLNDNGITACSFVATDSPTRRTTCTRLFAMSVRTLPVMV